VVRVWLLLALVACGGAARRTHHPGETWLSEIRLRGNDAIPDDDLIPGLALERARREGRAVDPYQLLLDTRRIRGAFVRFGYFDAKVDNRVDREDNAEIVTFIVVQGPRAKARVGVTGLPAEITEEAALAELPLKEGAPFDYELYDDGREVVKNLVADAGYPYVVDDSVVTVDRGAGVAFASYRLDSGIRATFGPVTITGVPPGGDLERAIRGRLTFREGDRYSPRALADTSQELYELGRFSQVRIEPDRSQVVAVVPIAIGVTVAGRTETRLGGGFGYEPLTYEARIRAGASYVPADYPLQTYSLDARIAATVDHELADVEPKIRILGGLSRVELWRPRLIGELGTGVDFFTVEAYTAKGGLLRLGVSSPLGRRWLTASAGWSLSYLEFTGISEALDARARFELGLRGDQVLGKYDQSITADLRDNQLEPRRGAYASLRLTQGTIAAAGALTFIELQPDVRGYWPWRSWVVAARARAGVIYGEVPVTERFFSGGAQNHRGFSARALSPTASTMLPNSDGTTRVASVQIGGEAMLETGAEARIPLGELIGLMVGTTLFVDGGDVVADPAALDLANLHWAAGAGIFAKYGGFKIRIDLGHRLTRRTSDGFIDNTLLFLGVGETY
jgi:translocation and assembly module TamA